MKLVAVLLPLSWIGAVCGFGGDAKDGFQLGIGRVRINGTAMCKREPYYGMFLQLVDMSQAVNDVISIGHTNLEGQFEVEGYYWYYQDMLRWQHYEHKNQSINPPKASWKVIFYSYCGLPPDITNQCHRVTHFMVTCKKYYMHNIAIHEAYVDACNVASNNLYLPMNETDYAINFVNLKFNLPGMLGDVMKGYDNYNLTLPDVDKVICLDGTVRKLTGELKEKADKE